ncbi:MAG: DUF1501 domain-containing protein [Planctomycetaceae bacterium]|nr:DUF1501 domain-containing protein [Planctomycetaceae bacterium]
MIRVKGSSYRHCDGVTRRAFLTAGALGLGGLTLDQLLRAEAAAGIGSSNKAVINIHLDGGPPQMDTIDMKPDAPSEVRGEFQPIATNLPGFMISELMPRVGSIADRFVFIRSLIGSTGRHDAYQCQSGQSYKDLGSIGGHPAMGCVVNKLKGTAKDAVPLFVDMMQGRPLVRNSARPGYLGPSYQPFRPDMSSMFPRELEDGMKKELAALGNHHTISLSLNEQLSARRIGDRRQLLSTLDRLRRDVDRSGMMDAMDHFSSQATEILISGDFANAMDLSQEDPRVVERFTMDASRVVGRHVTSDHPGAPQKLLMARRLIEVGVRCVSVTLSDFDTHSNNFGRMRQMLPIVDFGLHALITDLEERGMLDDVSIVIWGEFGRTPKINAKGGRDHWPRVGPAMLAGGGMNTGQVIGSTDRQAGSATSRPVTYKDIFATLYHQLGINPFATTITDPTGRPQYLLDSGKRLPEVL